jgi:hypothetical protein
MKPTVIAVSLAVAMLAACGDRIETSSPPATVVVPAPERSSPPPPATVPPVPPVSSQPAPDSATAKDTPANNPTGTLTKEQESSAMPKAGQANNHSSPAMDKDKKS